MNQIETASRLLVAMTLLFAMLAIVLALLFGSHPVFGKEILNCRSSRLDDGRYWSWRRIDHKTCWYPGRPGRNKHLLAWVAPPTAPRVAKPETKVVAPLESRAPIEPKRVLTSAILLSRVQALPPPDELVRPTPAPLPIPLPTPRPVETASMLGLALVPVGLLLLFPAVLAFVVHFKQRGPRQWPTNTTLPNWVRSWRTRWSAPPRIRSRKPSVTSMRYGSSLICFEPTSLRLHKS